MHQLKVISTVMPILNSALAAFRRTELKSITVLVLLAICLSACSVTYRVDKLDLKESFREANANVLSTGELSSETVQELRIRGLEEAFEEDPEKTLLFLEGNRLGGREAEQALALAEAAFYHANKLYDRKQHIESASYYLMAAAHSYDFLFYSNDNLSHSFVSPFGRFSTELYNASISRIIYIRETEDLPWTLPWEAQAGDTLYRFTREEDLSRQFPPHSFEEFIPAYEIRSRSLKNLYSSRGIGAPLVGKRMNPPDSPQYDPFFAPVISAPLTIFFKFSQPDTKTMTGPDGSRIKTRHVIVSLYDPFKLDSVNVTGKEYPIEADYSAAFGVLLKEVRPGRFNLDALLNPGNFVKQIKLTFLQPYDPNKIPVVLVHGLYSSPATYIQMLNDLMGVEAIRRKYQFWVFGYPTGLPIIESSTRLRAALRDAQRKFDPQGASKTFNQMVIVGHSMGGILSRTMVVENSKKLWEAFFTVPIDQLNLTAEERKYVRELGLFEALPFIRRAVFIAAPLRGTDIAQYSIVTRLTRWLVSLPMTLVNRRHSLLSKNKQYLKPSVRNEDFISVARTSVDNLRADSPVLAGYMNTPISPRVAYHSIIAIEDAAEGPGSSDGLVAYESSHLDGAVSETLVPTGHVCLEHPDTIAEVRRILLLHLAGLTNNAQKPSLSKTH